MLKGASFVFFHKVAFFGELDSRGPSEERLLLEQLVLGDANCVNRTQQADAAEPVP